MEIIQLVVKIGLKLISFIFQIYYIISTNINNYFVVQQIKVKIGIGEDYDD